MHEKEKGTRNESIILMRRMIQL